MASSKTKAAPVGTAQWVQNERDQAAQLVSLDVEEFSFGVRNELEWLNEHMDDIFSKSQKSFADMFKTPSRMRGKTPRTARKRDSLPTRQPLTDIFAPHAPSVNPAVQAIDFQKHTINFPIPADDENHNQALQHRPISRGKSPNRAGIPYIDSGYHGMTEDEMDVDAHTISIGEPSQTQEYSQVIPLQRMDAPTEQGKEGKADETGTSEESFVSAEEAVAARKATNPPVVDTQVSDDATVPDEEIQLAQIEAENISAPVGESQGHTDPMNVDEDNQSQSDLSSPENPLQRKSSFTFSALPAREPLGAKRSMGNRSSQMDFQPTRASTLSRSMGAKATEPERQESEEVTRPKPSEPEVRSKTSTQLLHERITMLGKTKEPRPSKSIPQNLFMTQASYPQLPDIETEAAMLARSISQTMRESHRGSTTIADDDDDWIAPSTKPSEATSQPQPPAQSLSPERPVLHQKSVSVTNISSAPNPNIAQPGHAKAWSVSHPNLANALQSTTPIGSPQTKKTTEGTISASKNRLWSAIKSAKSIFASSASASAAAKLEAHNNAPAPFGSPKRDASNDSGTTAVFNMLGALYSERELPPSPIRPTSVISISPKRTRSSTENEKRREKEAKELQKTTNNLEKVRDKERKKATKQRQEETTRQERAHTFQTKPEEQQTAPPQVVDPPSVDTENIQASSKPISSFKSSILSSGKLRAPGRPVRPTRGTAQSKPAPVSIRVASQSQRMGQGPGSVSALSKSQLESSTAAGSTKEGSNSRPSSAQSNKSGPAAPVNARVKALEAAARRKEADDRATQKKAEQKRELERKRALKAEEERRAEEERKAAEQQRIQEAKLAAQRKAEKQAAEARRREQERAEQQRREQERVDQERRREQERAEQQHREQERAEQLRQQEDARRAREAHELAEKISRERAQQAQQSHPRGDVGGTIRQLIKHTIPQLNPAKPAKRHVQPEDEEPTQAPQRPGIQRGPPSYQQNDAKRRRTNEEQDEPDQRRSVMAPPKRPSNLRKETLSKLPHGYTHAPNTVGAHHGPSMFKAAVTAQHQLYNPTKGPATHPSQVVQISNARIPFAENNNPPAAHHPSSSQLYPGYENGHPSASTNKFKTPARPGHGPKSAKSSPLYQNGDNIALPEIATDSEDEDSEDDGPTGFRAPSWVASPALRDLLTQQQLVDPESVFGPIAELKMDEVFKGAKNPERLKKFRDRGSSALWVESGDVVTSAEKRKDMELRERVAREGGWRYEPGA